MCLAFSVTPCSLPGLTLTATAMAGKCYPCAWPFLLPMLPVHTLRLTYRLQPTAYSLHKGVGQTVTQARRKSPLSSRKYLTEGFQEGLQNDTRWKLLRG